MLGKFSTKELIFIALMAALLFVINFTLGAGIIAMSGIPGSSAFITGITNALVFIFTILIVKKFGSGSLFYLIYGLIALPTHMAGGPPGYIPKVVVLVLAGLTYDVFLSILGYRFWGFVGGGIIASAVGLFGGLFGFYLLGMEELFNKLYPVIWMMYGIFVLLALVGLWLGYLIYKKLKNKSMIRQIQS